MRPEVWAGVEHSVVRVGDAYRSAMRRSGHDLRASDVERIASLGVSAVRAPVLWELVAPDGLDRADWRWTDERLGLLRAHGIRPIVGLLHHGSGPKGTSLLDDAFPALLAEYAAAVARRYPWALDFTPINEPLTTARFSALYGHWYPHARSASAFVRAVVNQCRAIVLAMDAIRAVTPGARLVQTEDYAVVRSTPRLAYQAEHENLRRWLTLDLLCGKIDASHPLRDYLRFVGLRDDELAWFLDRPRPPDVVGINYYVTSERYLDEDLAKYPAQLHGGNDCERYVDVEAARVGVPLDGHGGAIRATWERHRRPIAITEVHLGCTREEQLRWWSEAWRAACDAERSGADVRAVCAWALFGSHDWSSLLVEERGDYEPGAFDARRDPPRATAIARAVARTARSGRFVHPVLDVPGWWRRPSRVLYGPSAGGSDDDVLSDGRPILVTGGAGTLGRAIARVCRARGLAARSLSRAELDVGDAAAIERAILALRPWAIVNAAGFVRVDDAELDPVACWRANVDGPRLLAEACARRGVRLVTLSSDLVFDGRHARPYVEHDAPSPLSVYGASKAESERVVLAGCPSALVVRTSAFFGPWDEANFVHRAIDALGRGEPFRAPHDLVVSPTYVPDLADGVLDLLLDEERGVWHVANEGAVSWYELARRAAAAHGVSTTTLVHATPRRSARGPLARAIRRSPARAARPCVPSTTRSVAGRKRAPREGFSPHARSSMDRRWAASASPPSVGSRRSRKASSATSASAGRSKRPASRTTFASSAATISSRRRIARSSRGGKCQSTKRATSCSSSRGRSSSTSRRRARRSSPRTRTAVRARRRGCSPRSTRSSRRCGASSRSTCSRGRPSGPRRAGRSSRSFCGADSRRSRRRSARATGSRTASPPAIS